MTILLLALIALLAAADQILKYLVILYLRPIGSVSLIPGLLELRYLENTGAAFGILQDFTWLFTVLTAVISVVILIFLFRYRRHNAWTRTASVLIVAGGIGNLIDRISLGHVVDYIHVLFFDYIFNFADSLVVVGVILFAVYILFFASRKKEQKEPEAEDRAEEEPETESANPADVIEAEPEKTDETEAADTAVPESAEPDPEEEEIQDV